MKTKHTLVLLAILFIGTQANAQFFKKIKKKAENAIERTILNKTDREVSKTTDKTIDSVIIGKKNPKEKELTKEEKEAAEKEKIAIRSKRRFQTLQIITMQK